VTPDALFRVVNSVALLSWIVLAAAGRRRHVATLLTGVFVPLLLAATYSALIVVHWGEGTGSFQTLTGVAELFSNRWLLLAGWIHYLAFDLFIGSWEVRDAARLGIPHLAIVPVLALTFFFGPAGLLCYFLLRAALRKRLSIADGRTAFGILE
jgi:hypothetical protein